MKELEGEVVSQRHYEGIRLAEELGVLGKEIRIRVPTDRIRFVVETSPPELYHCYVCGFTSVYKGLYLDTERGLMCIGVHGLTPVGECNHVIETDRVDVVYAGATHTFCSLECTIRALQAVVNNTG